MNSAGLKPCVDLLLGVPDALRRALADADAAPESTTDVALDADLRSKIARCESPDRPMVALHGPEACRYVPHLDNDPSDPSNDAGTPGLRPSDRVFTCIAYLNPDWVPDHAGRHFERRLGHAADSGFVSRRRSHTRPTRRLRQRQAAPRGSSERD